MQNSRLFFKAIHLVKGLLKKYSMKRIFLKTITDLIGKFSILSLYIPPRN